jgi:predicted metal-dependent hydrolase
MGVGIWQPSKRQHTGLFGYNRRMSIPIDRLIRSKRKTVAIIVEHDGKVTVRAPMRLAERHIQDFVESHAEWIAKTRARLQAAPRVAAKCYVEGESILYLGRAYPLKIVARQRPAVTFDGAAFRLAKTDIPKAQEAFVRWYKGEATRLFFERMVTLAGMHGFHYQKIRISSARTRWGSCSSRGTLSFTYRLVMAPLEVVDYVVLHELVHTQVRNHSKTFWDKLGEILPDYKRRLAWLKKNGRSLM